MLIVEKIMDQVAYIKHNFEGPPLQIPLECLPENIKAGDILGFHKDEITTRRLKAAFLKKIKELGLQS